MKRFKNYKLLLCMGAMVCILQSGTNALAADMAQMNISNDNIKTSASIFDEKELLRLERRIANKPVSADIDDDDSGSGSISKYETFSSDTIKPNATTTSNNSYPTRKGLVVVTSDKYKGILPLGHAAMSIGSRKLVEALWEGVVVRPNDWDTSKKTCYVLNVSGTTRLEDKKAAVWCRKQCGKKYNTFYLDVDRRDKFYCSQLVWAAYKDLYNIDLDTSSFGRAVHPMELVDSPKTKLIYKKTS